MHDALKPSSVVWLRKLCRAALLLASMWLMAWQFLTFKELVQRHTAQAQAVSASAGWLGQPVGTMPQPQDSGTP